MSSSQTDRQVANGGANKAFFEYSNQPIKNLFCNWLYMV